MSLAAQAALFDAPSAAAATPASLPAAPAPDGWPAPPDPDAFTGLAGDVVAAIAPHTEADPVAILASLLVAFGSLAGPGPRYHVGATAHRANEVAVLVGPSGAGRKGSSWDAIETLLGAVDHHWANDRVVSGLSSGEGLIWHLRDRDDGPAPDRRLLVLEAELASVLKAAGRDQSTLSPVVPNAWDHRVLQVITKHDPARASDAHVAIIGHITAGELVRHVGATEIANGFLNRFLLICVRRSRLLPEGGQHDPATLAPSPKRSVTPSTSPAGFNKSSSTTTPAPCGGTATRPSPPAGPACGERPPPAPKPTWCASPSSTPCWTATPASPPPTCKPPSLCGTTPPAPPGTSSTKTSATPSPTTSAALSPRVLKASPAPSCATCSAATAPGPRSAAPWTCSPAPASPNPTSSPRDQGRPTQLWTIVAP